MGKSKRKILYMCVKIFLACDQPHLREQVMHLNYNGQPVTVEASLKYLT